MYIKQCSSSWTLRILRNAALGVVLALGSVSFGYAQIGSGWSSYSPSPRLQIEVNGNLQEWDGTPNETKYDNDATFSVSGSTYTFDILNSACSRVEIRWEDNLTGGTEQFQGQVECMSPVDNMHVFQIHGEVANAQELLDCDKSGGGTLKDNGDVTVATNVFGVYEQFNYIRDYNKKEAYMYINGSLKTSHSITLPASGDAYYSKCGIYGQGTGGEVFWKNVQFWQGGSASGSSGGGGGTFSGNYEIQSVASGLAANVKGASTSDDAPVVQYPFSSSQKNSIWTFIATSNGYYQVQNENSGMDMNVSKASTANGALITQAPFGSSGDDQWKPAANSDGSYSLYNLNSGLVLDVPGGSTSSDTQLDQYSFQDGSNQEWDLNSQ